MSNASVEKEEARKRKQGQERDLEEIEAIQGEEIFKDIMAEFGGQETFHLTSTLPDSMLNAEPFQWFLPLASCDPRVSVPLTPECLLPPGTVHIASLLGVPTQGLTLL